MIYKIPSPRQYFIPLVLLVLLLVLPITVWGMVISARQVRILTREAGENFLDKKMLFIEEVLGGIERGAIALAGDSDITGFSIQPGGSGNNKYLRMSYIVERLNDYIMNTGRLSSVYLYPLNNDKDVLSHHGLFKRSEFIDRGYLRTLDSRSYNRWQNARYFFLLPNAVGKGWVYSYIQPVPAINGKPQALLMINLPVSFISDTLSLSPEEGSLTIADRQGNIWADSLTAGEGLKKMSREFMDHINSGASGSFVWQEMDGKELVVYRYSKKTGWYFIYRINLDQRLISEPFGSSLFYLSGCLALMGLLAALILGRRIKPYHHFFREIEAITDRDEADQMVSRIRSYVEDNRNLRRELSRWASQFLNHKSLKAVCRTEESLNKWKGIMLSPSFSRILEETGNIINALEKEKELDDPYRIEIIREMIRFILVELARRGGDPEDWSGKSGEFPEQFDPTESLDKWKKSLFSLLDSFGTFLERKKGDSKEEMMQWLFRYIEDNYQTELYTDTIARKMNLSESYFCRVVKEVTGKTFGELVGEIRYGKVCELLKDTDEPLDAIAELTGLKSRRNLLRLFKKYNDKTPGKYRIISRLSS